MADISPSWTDLEAILTELCDQQNDKLLVCGKRLVSNLTKEDLLQPNDFLELECHPHFRYEEGVLIGIQTALSALKAQRKLRDEQVYEDGLHPILGIGNK